MVFSLAVQSQKAHELEPVVGRLRDRDAQRLVGRLPVEMGTGLEDIMIGDLGFNEGHLSEVALESAEGSGTGVEVGPFAFEGVVVGILEEGFVDEMLLGIDLEIAEGTAVTPQAVGEDLGVFPRGREGERHGEGIAGGLGVTARGEVAPQVEVISAAVGHPKPAFVPADLSLGFVDVESGFSSFLLRDFEQLVTRIGEQESRLVTPSRDGVMGDGELIEIAQGGHDGRSGHGPEEGEVERQGDGGRSEFHARPVKRGDDAVVDEAHLARFGDEVKRVLARERDVDLVGAIAFAASGVAVTAEAQAIREDFEDAHVGPTLGADELGILSRSWGSSGHELAATGLAPQALQARPGVLPEPVEIGTTTPRTTDGISTFIHPNLLSNRVSGLRTAMIAEGPRLERSYNINNVSLLR